jgi:hypothetical protein
MPDKDFASTPVEANITYGKARTQPPFSLSPDHPHATLSPEIALQTLPEIAAATEGLPPVAILVCHGMGQQVRYETIGQLADSLLTAATQQGCAVHTNGVQMALQNDDFLAHAELNWTDPHGAPHQVHIYEAYWAPITEGKVTYTDTIRFLFQAAWAGVRRSSLLRTAFFSRWMFGRMQTRLKIGPATQVSLIAVAAFLALQVFAIAATLAKLASQFKQIEAANFAWKEVILILMPGLHAMRNPGFSSTQHWHAFFYLIGWWVLVAEVLFVRYFLIQYVGSVAAYIEPYKDSKFDAIRHQIQAIGLDVAKVIYGFDTTTPVPEYERIIIAGHSLGSVLAYDTLNAIINLDQTSATPNSRRVVERTTQLITFGSPLDKTAFLFRNQSNHIADPLREQMAAASQPIILDYHAYRSSLVWTNLWSFADVISGSLGFYDADNLPPNYPHHVQNIKDPAAWIPFAAHVQYWKGSTLANLLYKAVQ